MSTASRIGFVLGAVAVLVPVAAYGRVPTSAAKASRYRQQQSVAPASLATLRPPIVYRSFSYQPAAAIDVGPAATSSYRSFSYAPSAIPATQESSDAAQTVVARSPSTVIYAGRAQSSRPGRVSAQRARQHPGSRRY